MLHLIADCVRNQYSWGRAPNRWLYWFRPWTLGKAVCTACMWLLSVQIRTLDFKKGGGHCIGLLTLQVQTLEVKEGSLHLLHMIVGYTDSDPGFQEGQWTLHLIVDCAGSDTRDQEGKFAPFAHDCWLYRFRHWRSRMAVYMHSTFDCTGSDPGVVQVHTSEIKEGSLHALDLWLYRFRPWSYTSSHLED